MTDAEVIRRKVSDAEAVSASIALEEPSLASLHDPEGYFVDLSGDAEEVMGYTDAQLLASNPYNVIHPDDVPTLSMYHVELLAGNMDGRWIRFRRKLPDGNYRWLETIAFLAEFRGAPVTASVTRRVEDQTECHVVDEDGRRVL